MTDNDVEVLQLIEKRFKRASPEYLQSNDFKKSVKATRAHVDSDLTNAYVHIKDFVTGLKRFDTKKKTSKKSKIVNKDRQPKDAEDVSSKCQTVKGQDTDSASGKPKGQDSDADSASGKPIKRPHDDTEPEALPQLKKSKRVKTELLTSKNGVALVKCDAKAEDTNDSVQHEGSDEVLAGGDTGKEDVSIDLPTCHVKEGRSKQEEEASNEDSCCSEAEKGTASGEDKENDELDEEEEKEEKPSPSTSKDKPKKEKKRASEKQIKKLEDLLEVNNKMK